MENNQKVSLVEKVAYGTGDMACNLFWALICVFAAIFYTDYFGISAAAAGTMMLVVRCIDITFDVIIGACADRKDQVRAVPSLDSLRSASLLRDRIHHIPDPDFSQGMKLAYAYVTYAAFMLMYSVVNVPYGALMGVMSADPEERTSISAYRNILAQAGCFVVYGSIFDLCAVLLEEPHTTGRLLNHRRHLRTGGPLLTDVLLHADQRAHRART